LDQTLPAATARFRERYIREVLEHEGWNVAAAARSLGVFRNYLYTLMARFQIKRPSDAPDDCGPNCVRRLPAQEGARVQKEAPAALERPGAVAKPQRE
jgi:hypothetical protein